MTPLAHLVNLQEIDLGRNDFSDVSLLTGLPRLERLYVRHNLLSAVSIDEHIPALQRRGVEVYFSPGLYLFPETESPFDIELVFLDDFTAEEQELWHRIANRWEAAIQMDFPDYTFSGLTGTTVGDRNISIPAGVHLDNLRIYIMKFDDVTPGGRPALGYAGLFVVLNEGSGQGSMPIAGYIGIQAELEFHQLWRTGLHEIGHVLGIGTNWGSGDNDMLHHQNGDIYFAGPQAIAAFNRAGGTDYQGAKVPVEGTVGGGHWHRRVLAGELMTSNNGSALSAITLGALSDLGYTVDFSAADPYELPPLGAAKPVADAVPFCSLEGLPAPVYVDD